MLHVAAECVVRKTSSKSKAAESAKAAQVSEASARLTGGSSSSMPSGKLAAQV